MPVSIAYLAVLIIWSTTPLAVAWSAETVSPVMAAWIRMSLAAVLGWIIIRLWRLKLPWHRKAVTSYAYSVLGIYGAMCCTYLAVQYIPSGLISVLYGLSPMVSGLLAQRVLGEQPFALHQWLAFGVAMLGLSQIFLEDLTLGGSGLMGILLLLAAVGLFATSAVMVKKTNADVHPLSHTVGALLLSIPCFGMTWWWLEGTLPVLDFTSHSPWAILYLATFGSLIGFVAYFFVLRRLSPSTVALVTLVTPVFALALGSGLNGEVITPSILTGSGLILSGLALYFWGGRLRVRRLKSA
ncbi:MAG: DMT family transporter [Gammaproteobacteria bacterium]|nr:DMT family transporter [Gammaproteobacteria bacterium]